MSEQSNTETVKETSKDTKNTEKSKKEIAKRTVCWLKSRANHIVEVKDGNVSKFIPPFGKVKVVKEQLTIIGDTDASYLTFIKA